jgi:hypothetical protein
VPVANTAAKYYVGSTPVDKIYVGANLIWSSFTPASIAGLKIWFDASTVVGAIGAAVDPWPNLAIPAMPGTMVGTPSPTVSGNVLNGKKLVRFKVDQGRMRMLGTGVTTDWTLAYVARIVAGGTNGRIVGGVYPPNNLLFGNWTSYEDVFYDNGFASPNTQSAFVAGRWKLYSVSGVPDNCYSNGVLMGTIAPAQGWGGSFGISGYDPTTESETCDCEVAEVMLYNRRLSDAERQQAEGYLRTKWGL